MCSDSDRGRAFYRGYGNEFKRLLHWLKAPESVMQLSLKMLFGFVSQLPDETHPLWRIDGGESTSDEASDICSSENEQERDALHFEVCTGMHDRFSRWLLEQQYEELVNDKMRQLVNVITFLKVMFCDNPWWSKTLSRAHASYLAETTCSRALRSQVWATALSALSLPWQRSCPWVTKSRRFEPWSCAAGWCLESSQQIHCQPSDGLSIHNHRSSIGWRPFSASFLNHRWTIISLPAPKHWLTVNQPCVSHEGNST